MIKHVGRHNNEKVAIMFRQIPEESHMALIVYTQRLPSLVHDELMKVLESEQGQEAKQLSDAAYRHTMANGDNCLTHIHKNGFMKKVPTNQVIVTPNATSSCRLDELNNILNEMETGDDAVKRLADLDAQQGLKDPSKTPQKTTSSVNTNSGDINPDAAPVKPTVTESVDGVISDAQLAESQRLQAAAMRKDAERLIAEAEHLEQEADALAPGETNARKTTKKKASRKKRATKKTASKKS